jgi:hypothetical protein
MQAVRLALTIGVALVVLAAMSWLLRIRELEDVVSIARERVRKLLG